MSLLTQGDVDKGHTPSPFRYPTGAELAKILRQTFDVATPYEVDVVVATNLETAIKNFLDDRFIACNLKETV